MAKRHLVIVGGGAAGLAAAVTAARLGAQVTVFVFCRSRPVFVCGRTGSCLSSQ